MMKNLLLKIGYGVSLLTLVSCGSKDVPELGSSLATVNIGKLSGVEYDYFTLTINKDGHNAVVDNKKFTSDSGTVSQKLKYGKYTFVMDYYKQDSKIAGTGECSEDIQKKNTVDIKTAQATVAPQICKVGEPATPAPTHPGGGSGGSGGGSGGSDGEADVSITPILKTNSASLTGDKALYDANCLSCHGADGLGVSLKPISGPICGDNCSSIDNFAAAFDRSISNGHMSAVTCKGECMRKAGLYIISKE